MTGNQNSEQECPACPWKGQNRYDHMRRKHGFTMSDWEGMTEAEKELAKKTRLEIRFDEGGQQLPYTTFQ